MLNLLECFNLGQQMASLLSLRLLEVFLLLITLVNIFALLFYTVIHAFGHFLFGEYAMRQVGFQTERSVHTSAIMFGVVLLFWSFTLFRFFLTSKYCPCKKRNGAAQKNFDESEASKRKKRDDQAASDVLQNLRLVAAIKALLAKLRHLFLHSSFF